MNSLPALEKKLQLLGWLLWGASMILTLSGLIFFFLNLPVLVDLVFPGFFGGLILVFGYGSVGLLLIHQRPRLPLGWLFMALAVPAAIVTFTEMYAIYGFISVPKAQLPGLVLAGWLESWIIYLAFPAPIALLCMLFPNGHLPSKRWIWVAWMAVIATIFLTINAIITPGQIVIYITENEIVLPMVNPTGVSFIEPYLPYLGFAWVLALLSIPLGLVSIITRFRTAHSAERRQLKWFFYFSLFSLAIFPLTFMGNEIVSNLVIGIVMIILPLATAIAILRYNLFDIDIVIRRTLQYTLLTGLLALAYFGGIVILQGLLGPLTGGTNSPLVTVISTLAIAALFNPLRIRVQDFIDRRFYRKKYKAEQALAQFAATVRDEVDMEKLTTALLGVVEETMQPESVSLWLKPTPKKGMKRDA